MHIRTWIWGFAVVTLAVGCVREPTQVRSDAAVTKEEAPPAEAPAATAPAQPPARSPAPAADPAPPPAAPRTVEDVLAEAQRAAPPTPLPVVEPAPRAKPAPRRRAKKAPRVRGRALGMMKSMGRSGPVSGHGARGFISAGDGGERSLPRAAGNTEEYTRLPDRPFEAVTDKPRSTLSIDVDTAAYANVRRFIESSRTPPRDAVRIEELINYFDYDYAGPEGGDEHPFAVHAEVSRAPWAPAHTLVRLGLQGRRIDTAQLPPSNLTFLIDVSGSMNRPNKLPLLKASFGLLTSALRPQDTVAIVVYAGSAGLVLPPTKGSDRRTILDALDRLRAGGSTAGGAGIQLAYEVAQRSFVQGGNNRVILATDGDFNVGVSSTGALSRLIEDKRKTGIYLTILGFGRGNYKDGRMEELSNKGNGNAAYIDSVLEANKVLVQEMGGTLVTIAKDVKIQVEFNPAHVKAWRLIGYENRRLADRDFNDDKKDAGELGAGHNVTALYELIPAGSAEEVGGVDPLKYQAPVRPSAEGADELMTVKLRYKPPTHDTSRLLTHAVSAPAAGSPGPAMDQASVDHRFAASVAEFGMLLRGDPHKAASSWPALIARARTSQGPDPHGYRADFVRLARKAEVLAKLASAR